MFIYFYEKKSIIVIVIIYHPSQMLAEGLDDGEDDAARRGLHGVALDVVLEAVGVGILLGIEAVEVHELEEGKSEELQGRRN